MDIKTMTQMMFPYWILGFISIVLTILSGNKNVVRVEKKSIAEWAKFLCILTVYRVILFKLFPHFGMFNDAQKNISIIPPLMTLTVFWEDACHGLPLFFVKKWVGYRKWLKPIYYIALIAIMIEFGAGHLYQGIMPALLLSLYVPYSIKAGEKYGFGTVMICHTLFDLVTILSVKYLLGA